LKRQLPIRQRCRGSLPPAQSSTDGLEGDAASGPLVASWPRKGGENCAIPIVEDDFYLVTVPAWNAILSMDISDPAAPREVSRVTFGADDVPHWISIPADQRRMVVTGFGGMQHHVLIARFDPENGELAMDERFRKAGKFEPGFRMDDRHLPHGGKCTGIPHGAVFSRP
jgi:hypothetical protein